MEVYYSIIGVSEQIDGKRWGIKIYRASAESQVR